VLLGEEFHRAGVEVVFLNRAIGGSAEDDLLLQVQGVIAEYERARILERSRRGRRHAALSGAVSAMGSAPYGYRYIGRHAGGGTAWVEVVEDEARMVRQLFAWVGVERVSLREAGRRLQALGCPTRTGLGHWDATTLCGMLRNPTVSGQRHVRPHPGGGAGAGCVAPGAWANPTARQRRELVGAGAAGRVDCDPGARDRGRGRV
jgi:site-specific DNA recombinase